MTDVTIYTKNNCVQCEQTKKWLDRNDIAYNTINIEQDPEAYNYVVNELGFNAAPVVTVITGVNPYGEKTFKTWSGFRIDNMEQLVGK